MLGKSNRLCHGILPGETSSSVTESIEVAFTHTNFWHFNQTAESLDASATQLSLQIGAITAKYAGTITYTEADEAARRVVMLAEAKDKSAPEPATHSATALVILVLHCWSDVQLSLVILALFSRASVPSHFNRARAVMGASPHRQFISVDLASKSDFHMEPSSSVIISI